MRTIALAAAALILAAAAAAGPFKPPADSRKVLDVKGVFQGYAIGMASNPLTILPPGLNERNPGESWSPARITHDFKPRAVSSVAEWEKVRADIRKRIGDFLGKLPPRDLPLDAKVEGETDGGDYTVRVVSLAFDKERRAKIGMVFPKGAVTPAPAIILYGAYDNGIEKMAGEVYSRAYAIHLARLGFVTIVQEHWYEEFKTSGDSEVIPLAASVYMGLRTMDYLATVKEVDPKRVAVFGHVYGAEIAPFLAAMDDRVAAVITSCSSDEVISNNMAYWGGPSWMGGSRGLGCIQRYERYMFVGTRKYELGESLGERGVAVPTLPFLSQEVRAMAAPRPFLSIMEDSTFTDSIRPAYDLYGDKAGEVTAIAHRWKTNLPVVAQEYMADFLLRNVCGIDAASPEAAKIAPTILAGLKGEDPAGQLRAARLAVWWKCADKDVVAELEKLVKFSKDVAVARTAAHALGRAGAMKVLIQQIKHPDAGVRLAVVEAMQLHGGDDDFDVLRQNASDVDRWVREAKFQTNEINPKEQ